MILNNNLCIKSLSYSDKAVNMGRSINVPVNFIGTSGGECNYRSRAIKLELYIAGQTGLVPVVSIRRMFDNYVLDFTDNTFKVSTPDSSAMMLPVDAVHYPGLYQYAWQPPSSIGGMNYSSDYAILYQEVVFSVSEFDYVYFYKEPSDVSVDNGIVLQDAIKEILAYCNGEISRDIITKINSYKDRQGNVLFTLEPRVDSRLRTESGGIVVAAAAAHYFNQMGVEVENTPRVPMP